MNIKSIDDLKAMSDRDFKNWAMSTTDISYLNSDDRLWVELRIAHMQKGYMGKRFTGR